MSAYDTVPQVISLARRRTSDSYFQPLRPHYMPILVLPRQVGGGAWGEVNLRAILKDLAGLAFQAVKNHLMNTITTDDGIEVGHIRCDMEGEGLATLSFLGDNAVAVFKAFMDPDFFHVLYVCGSYLVTHVSSPYAP